MRILVTGAGGFVGRHLLPILTARLPDAEICGLRADLLDWDQVADEVREVRPDAIVHLAAVSAIAEAKQDQGRTWRLNLDSTLHLARAVMQHAPDCTFLFASTGDAYGASFADGSLLTEASPLAPQNTYSATKAAADLALGAMAADGLRVVRLRPLNHTGAGQVPAFVVAAFARQVARIGLGLQPPILQVGSLAPQRDFLDVRDVCAAYAECVARRDTLAPGVILNLASGTTRRIGDILDGLLAQAGVTATIQPDPARMRGADIMLARSDATRARALLDWAPRVPWDTTLADVTADWQVRAAQGE